MRNYGVKAYFGYYACPSKFRHVYFPVRWIRYGVGVNLMSRLQNNNIDIKAG